MGGLYTDCLKGPRLTTSTVKECDVGGFTEFIRVSEGYVLEFSASVVFFCVCVPTMQRRSSGSREVGGKVKPLVLIVHSLITN